MILMSIILSYHIYSQHDLHQEHAFWLRRYFKQKQIIYRTLKGDIALTNTYRIVWSEKRALRIGLSFKPATVDALFWIHACPSSEVGQVSQKEGVMRFLSESRVIKNAVFKGRLCAVGGRITSYFSSFCCVGTSVDGILHFVLGL